MREASVRIPDHLAPASTRWPFTLEKWYVDVVTSDQTVVLVYLVRVRCLGIEVSRVTAELFSGSRRLRHSGGRGRVLARDDGSLSFGVAELGPSSLTWTLPGLSGRLDYRPRHPRAAIGVPLLESRGRAIDWVIEVPDADVTGWLEWPGGGTEIAGRGYRDRVWLDVLPWRFPIRELHWGRAVAGDSAAVWVHASTEDGDVSGGWRDGRLDRDARTAVELGPSVPFLTGGILDSDGLRLGALRRLLQRVGGNAHQVKAWSEARLDGSTGFSVHEVVRWG